MKMAIYGSDGYIDFTQPFQNGSWFCSLFYDFSENSSQNDIFLYLEPQCYAYSDCDEFRTAMMGIGFTSTNYDAIACDATNIADAKTNYIVNTRLVSKVDNINKTPFTISYPPSRSLRNLSTSAHEDEEVPDSQNQNLYDNDNASEEDYLVALQPYEYMHWRFLRNLWTFNDAYGCITEDDPDNAGQYIDVFKAIQYTESNTKVNVKLSPLVPTGLGSQVYAAEDVTSSQLEFYDSTDATNVADFPTSLYQQWCKDDGTGADEKCYTMKAKYASCVENSAGSYNNLNLYKTFRTNFSHNYHKNPVVTLKYYQLTSLYLDYFNYNRRASFTDAKDLSSDLPYIKMVIVNLSYIEPLVSTYEDSYSTDIGFNYYDYDATGMPASNAVTKPYIRPTICKFTLKTQADFNKAYSGYYILMLFIFIVA